MHGHHSIFVYESKDTASCRTLYKKINDYLSQRFAVIYAAEQDSDQNKILASMTKSGLVDEPEDRIQSGALCILSTKTGRANNSRTCHFRKDQGKEEKFHSLTMQEIRRLIRERKPKFKGILVIADASLVYDKTKSLVELLTYEKGVRQEQERIKQGRSRLREKQSQRLLQVICCYRKETLDVLPMRYLIPIVSYHDSLLLPIPGMMMTAAAYAEELNNDMILSIISQGINDIMGEGTDEMIFKTLKYIYKIDENSIAANPSLFEEKLQRICGIKSAPRILDSIANRLRQEIYRMAAEGGEIEENGYDRRQYYANDAQG